MTEKPYTPVLPSWSRFSVVGCGCWTRLSETLRQVLRDGRRQAAVRDACARRRDQGAAHVLRTRRWQAPLQCLEKHVDLQTKARKAAR